MIFTDGIQFSSSNLINNFLSATRILSEIKDLKLSAAELSRNCLKSLLNISSQSIAIVGEIIIDEYIFSKEMDKPSKENIHAVNFKKKRTIKVEF